MSVKENKEVKIIYPNPNNNCKTKKNCTGFYTEVNPKKVIPRLLNTKHAPHYMHTYEFTVTHDPAIIVLFSSWEVLVLLVSTRNCDFWPDSIFWAYIEFLFQFLSQSDLSDLMASLWIVDLNQCWTFAEVAILGTDQKEHSLWRREGQCCCNHYVNQGKTLHTCICQVTIEHGQLGHLKSVLADLCIVNNVILTA